MSTPTPINVLQLIDSLDAGGGERMSVHLANTLSDKVNFSSLIATRHSGILENDILPSVKFCCLNKTSALDLRALFKLKKFVKKYHIDIIHAHSTSFFLATQLKIIYPKIKIVWHDHYGFRHNTSIYQSTPLLFCSSFFSQIIAVNHKLKTWANQNLWCANVDYLQNFSLNSKKNKPLSKVNLRGNQSAYKIIHVANLRPQKDHLTALKAIKQLVDQEIDLSYHLIGNYDEESLYYKKIVEFIKYNHLSNHVFIYGSQNDISSLLDQSNMGILSSVSEGLPVSLIEYAQAKLPVVVTDVGQCKDVVGDFAQVIKPKDDSALAKAIEIIFNQKDRAINDAIKLNKKIKKEFDPEKIIQKIIFIYRKVLS